MGLGAIYFRGARGVQPTCGLTRAHGLLSRSPTCNLTYRLVRERIQVVASTAEGGRTCTAIVLVCRFLLPQRGVPARALRMALLARWLFLFRVLRAACARGKLTAAHARYAADGPR